MTEVPAGWYADPEDASQNRYWNGFQWTDSRMPKPPPPPPKSGKSAWGLVPDTFSLSWRYSWKLFLIALPLVVLQLIFFAAAFAAVDSGITPGLSVIMDRLSGPGFNPDNAPDEAFLRSISFSITATSVVLIILTSLAYLFGTILTSAAISRFAAGAHYDNAPSIGEALRHALRRSPRLFGIFALSIGALCLAALIMVILATFLPWALLIAFPTALVGFAFLIPILSVASQIIALGPATTPSLSTAWELTKGRWWRLVGRLLIIALVVGALGTPFGLINGAAFSASIVTGFIFVGLGQIVQNIYSQVGTYFIYLWIEGPIDPELRAGAQQDTID